MKFVTIFSFQIFTNPSYIYDSKNLNIFPTALLNICSLATFTLNPILGLGTTTPALALSIQAYAISIPLLFCINTFISKD